MLFIPKVGIYINNMKLCPKCSFNDILRILGKAEAYGSGNNISTGATIFRTVKVTRYMCFNCGYSEEWIDDKEEIKKLKGKYR